MTVDVGGQSNSSTEMIFSLLDCHLFILLYIAFDVRKGHMPMLGDLFSGRDPDIRKLLNILDKGLNCGKSARFTAYPAMQADRHHLWVTVHTFSVQNVERALEVL